MIVRRNDLLDVLKLIKPGIGEVTLGGFPQVLFDNGWVKAINAKLIICYKFDTGIDGCLPFNDLYRALKIFKTNGIAITSSNEQAIFKSGFSELSLKYAAGKANARAYLQSTFNNVERKPIPTNLLEGLKLTLLSIDDVDCGRLSGVILDKSHILSTNNHRISMFDLSEKITDGTIRLTGTAVKELIKLNKSFDSIGCNNNWVLFKSGDNFVVGVKQYSLDNYPLQTVRDVFNVEPEPEVYSLPSNLDQYIDRAEQLAGVGEGDWDYTHLISLKSLDGNLVITGSNGVGSLVSKIPWNGVLPEITIEPFIFKKLLKLTRSFRVSPENNMVSFEIPNFRLMIMAMIGQIEKNNDLYIKSY